MKIRIVIQCRLSSSRLPAKALLSIAGLPAVVLCAKRATNSGIDVLVATSTDITDDYLVNVLHKYNIPVIRGALDDVLARYILAIQDMANSDVIVRLTADNMFPDGKFIEELVDDLRKSNLKYLGTESPEDGLAYGLSAEAFLVESLREAAQKTTAFYDRENVTCWLKRNFRQKLFKPTLLTYNLSHLRCTLDTFDDYVRINEVFKEVNDPINISYVELCEKLSCVKNTPHYRIPFRCRDNKAKSIMSLGTVQLGMTYGRTNITGKPSKDEALRIIKTSIDHGITLFDTARSYGDSEKIIGHALQGGIANQVDVVTKLMLPASDKGQTQEIIDALVERSVFRSCRELRMQQLYAVLLHRWEHYSLRNGMIWQKLISLKQEGFIKKLGVSVYDPSQAIEALTNKHVSIIQIPYHILDRRWEKSEFVAQLPYRHDVEVHVRSAFLQGILCANEKYWPAIKNFDNIQCIKKITTLKNTFNRKNNADLCLAYLRTKPWITTIILGVETLQQLHENMRLFNLTQLSCEQANYIESFFSNITEELLNPSLWKK